MLRNRRLYFSMSFAAVLSMTLVIVDAPSDLNAGGISLRPPFNGSFPVTSWFDHDLPDYTKNGILVVYTGERSGDCSPPSRYGYCYDGHSGIDYGMATNTPIIATANGTVITVQTSSTGYGNRIVIKHDNEYRTLYAHLNMLSVSNGQIVKSGDIIGYSGSTGNSSGPHLHFGVYRNQVTADERNATDPYGWRGTSTDPLNYWYSGLTAECIWRSTDIDPISCADTIIEDGQSGFGVSSGWLKSTIGNSYQLTYHINDNSPSSTTSAVWSFNNVQGVCKLYVWIPSQFATGNVSFYIYGSLSGFRNGWIVNQASFTNQWVYLASYTFLGSDYPLVYILGGSTGQPINTKWIGADAIKFRCYKNYSPVILK
jgi:hypothetical protein